MRVTNQKINFLPKGHFISNLKKPLCASKRDVLELVTVWYYMPWSKVSILEVYCIAFHTVVNTPILYNLGLNKIYNLYIKKWKCFNQINIDFH